MIQLNSTPPHQGIVMNSGATDFGNLVGSGLQQTLRHFKGGKCGTVVTASDQNSSCSSSTSYTVFSFVSSFNGSRRKESHFDTFRTEGPKGAQHTKVRGTKTEETQC